MDIRKQLELFSIPDKYKLKAFICSDSSLAARMALSLLEKSLTLAVIQYDYTTGSILRIFNGVGYSALVPNILMKLHSLNNTEVDLSTYTQNHLPENSIPSTKLVKAALVELAQPICIDVCYGTEDHHHDSSVPYLQLNEADLHDTLDASPNSCNHRWYVSDNHAAFLEEINAHILKAVEDYVVNLELYRKQFPDEICFSLLLIEVLLVLNKLESALKLICTLSRSMDHCDSTFWNARYFELSAYAVYLYTNIADQDVEEFPGPPPLPLKACGKFGPMHEIMKSAYNNGRGSGFTTTLFSASKTDSLTVRQLYEQSIRSLHRLYSIQKKGARSNLCDGFFDSGIHLPQISGAYVSSRRSLRDCIVNADGRYQMPKQYSRAKPVNCASFIKPQSTQSAFRWACYGTVFKNLLNALFQYHGVGNTKYAIHQMAIFLSLFELCAKHLSSTLAVSLISGYRNHVQKMKFGTFDLSLLYATATDYYIAEAALQHNLPRSSLQILASTLERFSAARELRAPTRYVFRYNMILVCLIEKVLGPAILSILQWPSWLSTYNSIHSQKPADLVTTQICTILTKTSFMDQVFRVTERESECILDNEISSEESDGDGSNWENLMTQQLHRQTPPKVELDGCCQGLSPLSFRGTNCNEYASDASPSAVYKRNITFGLPSFGGLSVLGDVEEPLEIDSQAGSMANTLDVSFRSISLPPPWIEGPGSVNQINFDTERGFSIFNEYADNPSASPTAVMAAPGLEGLSLADDVPFSVFLVRLFQSLMMVYIDVCDYSSQQTEHECETYGACDPMIKRFKRLLLSVTLLIDELSPSEAFYNDLSRLIIQPAKYDIRPTRYHINVVAFRSDTREELEEIAIAHRLQCDSYTIRSSQAGKFHWMFLGGPLYGSTAKEVKSIEIMNIKRVGECVTGLILFTFRKPKSSQHCSLDTRTLRPLLSSANGTPIVLYKCETSTIVSETEVQHGLRFRATASPCIYMYGFCFECDGLLKRQVTVYTLNRGSLVIEACIKPSFYVNDTFIEHFALFKIEHGSDVEIDISVEPVNNAIERSGNEWTIPTILGAQGSTILRSTISPSLLICTVRGRGMLYTYKSTPTTIVINHIHLQQGCSVTVALRKAEASASTREFKLVYNAVSECIAVFLGSSRLCSTRNIYAWLLHQRKFGCVSLLSSGEPEIITRVLEPIESNSQYVVPHPGFRVKLPTSHPGIFSKLIRNFVCTRVLSDRIGTVGFASFECKKKKEDVMLLRITFVDLRVDDIVLANRTNEEKIVSFATYYTDNANEWRADYDLPARPASYALRCRDIHEPYREVFYILQAHISVHGFSMCAGRFLHQRVFSTHVIA